MLICVLQPGFVFDFGSDSWFVFSCLDSGNSADKLRMPRSAAYSAAE